MWGSLFLGLCVKCGIRKQESLGKKRRRKFCGKCRRPGRKNGNRKYRKYLKGVCGSCGFIPEHECQLDVDHIDGDRKNNQEANLQTLCANCHRLKTYKQKHLIPHHSFT